jgi:AraC family transcriptional regulator, activator of mtrCDE
VIDQLLEDLTLDVEPFARCVVSSGWRLRLDEGEGATLHFVLSGHGNLRLLGGPQLVLRPYTLVVVPDQRAHTLEVPPVPLQEVRPAPAGTDGAGLPEHVAGIDGDRELLVACGRVDATYGRRVALFGVLDRPIAVDFTGSADMAQLFHRLLEESTGQALGQATMLRASMTQCLVLLLRRLVEDRDDVPLWARTTQDRTMAAVVAAVLRAPGDPHSVESLARLAHLGRSAFAERFVTTFGRTPMAFVREVRLERAAELLRSTTLDIATIAHRTGFASRSHFSRTFREAFGVPPAEHRRLAEHAAA